MLRLLNDGVDQVYETYLREKEIAVEASLNPYNLSLLAEVCNILYKYNLLLCSLLDSENLHTQGQR